MVDGAEVRLRWWGIGEEGKKRAKLCLKRMKSKPQGQSCSAALVPAEEPSFSLVYEWPLCVNRIVLQNAK